MENIESITLRVPKSQVGNLMDIVSKYNWEVVSKSDFTPNSISEEARNSEQFVAMMKRYAETDAIEACNGAWGVSDDLSTDDLIDEISSMRRNSSISDLY